MSDPVTNVEIEDVLSSIRRLVSADDRSDVESEDTAEAAPEKLVLTPALRVSVPEKPQETVEAETVDDTTEHQVAEDVSEPEEPTAEADDGTPVQDVWSDEDDDHHDDSDTSDAQVDDHHNDDHHNDDQHHEEHHDDDLQQDDHEAEHVQADTPDAEGDHESLSSHITGIEDAVAARDDAWEPDGDDRDDDNAAQPMEETLPWQDHDEDAQADKIEDAEVVPATEGLDAFELEDDELAPELSAPVPDPVAAQAAVNAFSGADDPLGDDDTILDEEALRDLVTEIVRQELQGSLGERITRNVRKLVRREIHRALTTQELE